MKRKLLIITLIIVLSANTGCTIISEGVRYFSADRDRQVDISVDNGFMSLHTLVQIIVDSIRSDNDIDRLFQSIPPRQREEITFDQYQQYIRLLRRGIAGDISSFSLIGSDDLEAIKDEMLEQRPDQAETIEATKGIWLHFREIGRFEETFAIFLHQKDDEPVKLSSEWINQSIFLSEVAILYFDAIERTDIDALTVLLSHERPDRSNDILKAKARQIIDYYHDHVSTRSSEFRVLQARMDSLQFEALGAAGSISQSAVSRIIEFRSRSDQRFELSDTIPDHINKLDLNVFFSEQHLFQMAALDEDNQPVFIRSNVLESIVGEPRVHTDDNCATVGSIQRITLEYDNMDLIVEGNCFRHSRWEGSVREVTIHDSQSRLGSGLRPGHSLNDILRRYPFADETNFIITGQFDGGSVQMMIDLDNEDIIDSIELRIMTR